MDGLVDWSMEWSIDRLIYLVMVRRYSTEAEFNFCWRGCQIQRIPGLTHDSTYLFLYWLFVAEKKDSSPNEEWGVNPQLISKLKEQYKRERQKEKKTGQVQDREFYFFNWITLQLEIISWHLCCIRPKKYLIIV